MLKKLLSKIIFIGERASMSDIDGINLSRYIFASKFTKRKNVIEIGCGSGYGSKYLGKNGALMVDAYDADGRAITFAQETFNIKNVNFIAGRIEDLDTEKKYDVAVSFEVVEHLNHPASMIKKVKSTLKKRGIFIISTPNRALSSYDGDKPSNPYHVKEYYCDEFYRLLKKQFSRVVLYGIFLKGKNKEIEENIQKNWRWKFAALITKKRWIRFVINFLPEAPKRIFTGEKKLKVSPGDFVFLTNNPQDAPYLIAVCKSD